ncbi:MAG: peptidase MA family metallohydrolase [Pseudomonadales bacterium]|nr:peptidase MA family metallohydrolase [Pseudomonadales bacterium]
MNYPKLLFILLLSMATVFQSQVLLAADNPAPETQSDFEQARLLAGRGSYLAAIELYRRVDGFQRDQAIIEASRAHWLIGQLEEAENICREAINGDYAASPLISTQLAEVLRSTGRAAEALEVLSAVIEPGSAPVRSLVQYGSLLQFLGRKQESLSYLNEAHSRYLAGQVFDAEEIAMVALGNWLADRFHDANSLFSEAVRIDPMNHEAQVLWGNLFMEKFNNPDAQRSYAEVLENNRRYVPALLGMAKISNPEMTLQRILDINPAYVPALEEFGNLLIQNNRIEEGSRFLQEALLINPQSIRALSILAAQDAMHERMDDYQARENQINAFSPDNAVFYTDIGEIFGNNYRFTEAVEYTRKAIAADPTYWRGHTILGSNLVRLGLEEEGKRHLELAFANDPFNVLTSNLLQVFDTLEGYATLESEHFRVNMSPRDAEILWPYFEPLLEESWDTLTAKYGFEPEVPVLIQVFENTEDFAVRSVGLPDIGPLVGICFGKVVTLISPDTLSANWQEILWHELVHVFTLQMTNNRMPRWLSEGISVWEEHEARPEWGRRQGLDLVRAARDNKLLPVAELNSGFTNAGSSADLGFAYFQSYLVVDYIAREFGFESLRNLVQEYAFIRTEDEMFQNVFDQSLEVFNEGFMAWIDRRVEEINVYVHTEDAPDEGAGHGHGVRENSSAVLAELYNNASLKQHMRQRIQSEPRDFQAHLQLGIVLFKEENYQDAEVHLSTAHELLPDYSGYPSPPLVLSQLYEAQGREQARQEQLEVLLQNQQHDYESALTLANLSLAETQFEQAEYYVQRALAVDPYRLDVHRVAAELANRLADTGAAVREHEILVRLDQTDPVVVRTDLARAYLNNGQPDEARYSVLRALEIAPSYPQAQKVLLESLNASSN